MSRSVSSLLLVVCRVPCSDRKVVSVRCCVYLVLLRGQYPGDLFFEYAFYGVLFLSRMEYMFLGCVCKTCVVFTTHKEDRTGVLPNHSQKVNSGVRREAAGISRAKTQDNGTCSGPSPILSCTIHYQRSPRLVSTVFIGVHSIPARLTSLALHPVQPPCMRWKDILDTHFSSTLHF